MIRLFDRNETNFNHNETTLTDVLSAKVIEEGNGMFEVEIEHPRNEFAKTLTAGKVVKVPTARGDQLFRIYKPVKNLTRYKLYARHIFYDLAKNFIEDIRPTGKNGMSAIDDILTAAQYAHPFTGTSDISDIGTAYYVRMNPIQAMLSADNSFLDTWGGELVRDNFTFSIDAAGGSDRGYEIRIGKNLTGIDVDMDETAVYTRLYPTVVINDNVVTTLPEKYVDSPLIEAYEYPKIIEERISLTDDQKGWPVEDIYTLMRDHCADLFESGIDKPVINYKVNFVELSKTEQYKDLQILEQLNLYDTVTIRVAELDIDIKAKVVKTTYDGLKKRYISMELGSFKENMASQTKNTLQQTDKKINAATSSLQQAFDKAQSMITGNLGGYRIDRYNAEGLPYETLWMDTPDINTAVNVIRINQQGIGFSQSGYNGPFKAAITIDGHIVADFIDVGTLTADLIKTGTLTGANMWLNLVTGEMQYTNPTTGDLMTMKQGRLQYQTGQNVYYQYYDENGLIVRPSDSNTGDGLNTGMTLIGNKTYFDFLKNGSTNDYDARIIFNETDLPDGLQIRNALGGIYLRLASSIPVRVQDNYVSFVTGVNSTTFQSDGFLKSGHILQNTTSGTANVHIRDDGVVLMIGSATKYKNDIQPLENDVDYAKQILNLHPKSWIDKGEQERGDVRGRYYGVIAEDVEALGLSEYTTKNEDGELESVQYDRLWTLLLPVVREQESEIKNLKQELAALKALLTERGVI